MPITTPPEGLLSRVQTLEQALVALAANPHSTESGRESWRRQIDALRDLCRGDEAPLAAVADELNALAHAVAPEHVAPSPAQPMKHRFGYGVTASEEGGDAVVVPSFARVLTHDPRRSGVALADDFPELALADHTLWSDLRAQDAPVDLRALVPRWLALPARRLAWNVGALEDLSADELLRAIGDPRAPRPPVGPGVWPPLYDCMPYDLPVAAPDDETVILALRSLDTPPRQWARGRALTTLLDRAAEEPSYRVGALRRDLRDELPARVAGVVTVPADDALVELEQQLLRVALALLPGEPHGARVYAVARWVGYVLRRSPFHVGDPGVLAARLRGMLRHTPVRVEAADRRHPSALLDVLENDLGRWREYTLTVGAASHYLNPARESVGLVPIPSSLEQHLLGTASRLLTDAEAAREGDDALPGYGSAPWLARATLHAGRSPWLSSLPDDALGEVLSALRRSPVRFGWVFDAVMMSARWLRDGARSLLAEYWRGASAEGLAAAHRLALLASVAFAHLAKEDATVLHEQARRSAVEWRSFVCDELATAARNAGDLAAEASFVDALARVAEDTALPDEVRLHATALWLRRLAPRLARESAEMRRRVVALGRDPVIVRNETLRSEYMRLGLSERGGAGGNV